MNKRELLACLSVACLLMSYSASSFSRVETLAIPCADDRVCLWDRPVLSPPAGWELQQEFSNTSHLSIYGPPPESGDKAEAFMVARAVRLDPGQTQQQFIETELDYVLSRQLDLHALATTPLKRDQGQEWPVYRIATERENDPVESMVFGQDGNFFVVFILSARNPKIHDLLWQKFNDWVLRYLSGETLAGRRVP